MPESIPVRRTTSESSFLQSLAYIHMETRSKRNSMNNNAVWDINQGVQSVPNKKTASRPVNVTQRRASVSDVAKSLSRRSSLEVKDVTPTYEKERSDVQGILRTQDTGKDKDKDVTTSSQRRVSFSHQTGTLRRVVSDVNIKSLPKNTFHSSSIYVRRPGCESVPASFNVLTESSIKSSFKQLHTSPPRPFPGYDNNRNISSMFLTGEKISLPFHTTPTLELSRPCRRYSMLEMEQINRQETGRKGTSPADISPPSLSLQRRRSDGVNSDKAHQQTVQKEFCHSRSDYTLGEAARSTSHMIIESCPEKALHRASQLKNHDFAFVKRMDGSWTYAILAFRSFVDGDSALSEDECMMFVMNEEGSTKTIKKRQWAEFVRCVVEERGAGP